MVGKLIVNGLSQVSREERISLEEGKGIT